MDVEIESTGKESNSSSTNIPSITNSDDRLVKKQLRKSHFSTSVQEPVRKPPSKKRLSIFLLPEESITEIKRNSLLKVPLDDEGLHRTSSVRELLAAEASVRRRSLFKTVRDEQAGSNVPSIILRGFDLKNVASVQMALNRDKKASSHPTRASSNKIPNTWIRSSIISKGSSSSTQTVDSISTFSQVSHKKRLKHLMGFIESDPEESVEGSTKPATEAMKNGQRYLQDHRIFEFFQFIISHLLSAIPDNPIAFILKLLEQCLLYRTGMTKPPLLYERGHLERLFYLMDITHTDYIDLKQYEAGMRTIGVYAPNKPFTTADGLVKKDDFIKEAYHSLSLLFDDMVKL